MAADTQTQHILTNANFDAFRLDIARWTSGEYIQNAGYNLIQLPQDTSGANGQNNLPGHNGSHPGYSRAQFDVLDDIRTREANGTITAAEARQEFTKMHAHFRGVHDLGSGQTQFHAVLNIGAPEADSLPPITVDLVPTGSNSGAPVPTLLDPANNPGDLTAYMTHVHGPQYAFSSLAARRAADGVNSNGSFGSLNAVTTDYGSSPSASFRDANGIGVNAVDTDGNITTITTQVDPNTGLPVITSVSIYDGAGNNASLTFAARVQQLPQTIRDGFATSTLAFNDRMAALSTEFKDAISRALDDPRGTLNAGFDALKEGAKDGAIAGAGGFAADFFDVLSTAETRGLLTDALNSGDYSAVAAHVGEEFVEAVLWGVGIAATIGAVATIPLIGPPIAIAATAYFTAMAAYEFSLAVVAYAQDEAFWAALDNALQTGFTGDAIDVLAEFANTNVGQFILNALAASPAGIAWDIAKEGVAFLAEFVSPLVIDLDGDGVELVSLADSNAFFDLDINGFAEFTGWVAADDALLALDLNGNGKIDDNSELFGDQTGFADGFAALAAHDLNADGVIDANDAVFADLLLWQDANGNGYSEEGELVAAASSGLVSIALGATSITETNAGHDVLLRSTVAWDDGSSTNVDDVYFERDTRTSVALLPDNFTFDADTFRLPTLFGYGEIAATPIAYSLDASLKADARALLAQATAGDISAFMADFEPFLLKWAGVDGADPASRSSNVGSSITFDSRHLLFLEKAYGEEYVNEQNEFLPDQVDPGNAAAIALTEQFDELKEKLAIRFLAQTATSEALMTATTQAEYDTIKDGHVLSTLAQLVDGYAPSDRQLTGDFAGAFDGLAAAVDAGNLSLANAVLAFGLLDRDTPDNLGDVSEALAATFRDSVDWSSAGAKSIILGNYNTKLGKTLISGTQGDDTLASNTEAILIGGQGNDTLTGGAELDTYFYYEGDGTDVILDTQGYYQRNDRLVYVVDDGSLTADRLNFDHDDPTGDLVITNGADTIIIQDHFLYGFGNSSAHEIEEIEITTIGDLIRTDQNEGILLNLQDIREKTAWDQKASGSVLGTKLFDNFRHYEGDGRYTINDNSGWDRLSFLDLNTANVAFERTPDLDLRITTQGGDVITVLDHFVGTYSGFPYEMDEVLFADGTALNSAAIWTKVQDDYFSSLLTDPHAVEKAAGAVTGGQLEGVFKHWLGDGSYTISDYSTENNDIDRMIFVDQGVGDVSFQTLGNDDMVIAFANGDVVTILDQFVWGGRNEIEEMRFADGTILDSQGIRNKAANDQLAAGAVVGSRFDDHYTYDLSMGSTDIWDHSHNNYYDTDKLIFADQNASDVTFQALADDNLIITTADGDVIRIIDQFRWGLGLEIEQIQFADGSLLDSQAIRDKAAQDMLASGTVYGTNHNETYSYDLTMGSATITENSGRNHFDLDKLVLTDQTQSDVTIGRSPGDDLQITLSDGDVITVVDHFLGGARAMEQIVFSDGSVLTEADLTNTAVMGTAGSDYLFLSGSTSDVVYGLAGDDTIQSNAGHDLVHGGEGNDSLIEWSGNDTLYGDEGNDTINGGSGNDFHYGGAGDDLIIAGTGDDFYNGGSGDDTIDFRYYGGNAEFDLTAGTVLMAGLWLDEIEEFENLIAGVGHDTILGTSGANDLNAGSGNDRITGGLGADTLTGGSGNDTFVFVAADTGVDEVTDFAFGPDRLDISAWGATGFGDLTVVSTQNGGTYDVDVSYNGNALKLTGVVQSNLALLDGNDFLFT